VAVFHAAQHADLALDGNSALMRVIDHFPVTSTFSSKLAGVLPSSLRSRPS